MLKSGFFHPETLTEFGSWNDIEAALGAERGLALVEHGNVLDLFFAALQWLSDPRARPAFVTRYENFWSVCRRWLCVGGEGYTWVYTGPIKLRASEMPATIVCPPAD